MQRSTDPLGEIYGRDGTTVQSYLRNNIDNRINVSIKYNYVLKIIRDAIEINSTDMSSVADIKNFTSVNFQIQLHI